MSGRATSKKSIGFRVGGNYGWRVREGAHCYPIGTASCAASGNGDPLIDPVAEYDHTLGISITGGYVYRGSAIASLAGRYVFGDFGSARIFALIPNGSTFTRTELLRPSANISSFAQGSTGELYYLDYGGGIFKLVPGSGTPSNPIKTLLSQTGCFEQHGHPSSPHRASFRTRPLRRSGRMEPTKARWMALPDGAQITVETDGDWTFPNGTVLVKNFALNSDLFETRLFMRHTDTGNWGGYTYRWNTGRTRTRTW